LNFKSLLSYRFVRSRTQPEKSKSYKTGHPFMRDSKDSEFTETPGSANRTSLDPNADTMRRLGYELIDRIVDHLTTLSDQRVARRGNHAQFAELVDEPLPLTPSSIDNCLDFFFERIVPDMTRVNHPRFHAFIPCPSSFAGAIGEMLAAGTNPFAGSWLGGATVSALELTVLRWIAEMLDYAPKAAGIFTSGGSMANLVGLAAARAKTGRDALRRGTLYVSSEGHASVCKAAAISGFSKESIRTIPVDTEFRMDLNELERAIETDRSDGRLPFFVSANAGTTNTGAIDPLAEIADICADKDLWFHVDAAYGGFAAITPEGRGMMRGMTRADSLTLDPHKWLYCPMGVGCALVREPEFLERAFSTHGSYLKDLPTDEVNFLDRGPELSRPARVLSVWMVIRSVGLTVLANQIREDMRLAQLAAKLLSEDTRLEVHEPVLSIVTFRHRPRVGETESDRSSRDTALMETTLDLGDLMLSTTMLRGQNTLRFVVMNHRTTEADVRRSVSCIRQHAT
jgi:aromatic-L-amino-acid decarboxylase